MNTADSSDITRLLHALSDGVPGAADALVPRIYDELHLMASRALRGEAVGHTLQPTALVHEAYLRMVGGAPAIFVDRTHFFSFAARIMRRVLVDQARARRASKRGGGLQVTLELPIVSDAGSVEDQALNVIAIEEALTRLEVLDARAARVVELRVYGGLSVEETGAALDVSPATVKRDWMFARAFLKRELKGSAGGA